MAKKCAKDEDFCKGLHLCFQAVLVGKTNPAPDFRLGAGFSRLRFQAA